MDTVTEKERQATRTSQTLEEGALESRRPDRQAVLVFAGALALDLQRRRWPTAFGALLKTPNLEDLRQEGIDVHFFTRGGAPPDPLSQEGFFHQQQGHNFGERLENAVARLQALGYSRIVIIGRDCPDLTMEDIRRAFRRLHSNQLVLGPDHRGGCYLIGLQAALADRLQGIHWQQNKDLNQLRQRFAHGNVFLLPVKQDLDTLNDLKRLICSSAGCLQQVAEALLRLIQADGNVHASCTIRFSLQEEKRFWQLPPPCPVL